MNPASGSALLSSILPWWEAFLKQTRANRQALALLTAIFDQTLSYLLAGYSTGVLPIKTSSVSG